MSAAPKPSAMAYMLSNGLPPNVAADYATGYMDAGAGQGVVNAASAFSAMPSGAQAQSHDVLNFSPPPAELSRADGFDTRQGQYFTSDWVNNRANRMKMLYKDPEYAFLSRVAGFSGREAERLYDVEALDQHARRMLQRAAVAEELSKTALSDIDHANTVIKDIARRNNETLKNYTDAVRALTQVKNSKAEWDSAKAKFRTVQATKYSPDKVVDPVSFNKYLTLYARIHSPSEGVDNAQFAERLLSFITALAQKRALVSADYVEREPATSYETRANEKIPLELHLSVFWTFTLYATKSHSALEYAARRMYNQKSFPAESVYAKDDVTMRLFCDDIRTLVDLVSFRTKPASAGEAHTQNAVSMKTMSALLFIHLRRMHSRWYPTDATTGAPPADAPVFLKPTRRQGRAQGRARRIQIVGQTRDEEEEPEMLFVDVAQGGSALSKEQRQLMNTTNPDQYQNFLITVLGGLYRFGTATLFYDTDRLRGILCKDSENVKSALLCSDIDGKFKILHSVAPDQNVENVIATTDYFFGGMDTRSAGSLPSVNWMFDDRLEYDNVYGNTTLYIFFDGSLRLFESVALAEDWEWFTNENGLSKKTSTLQNATALFLRRFKELLLFMPIESNVQRNHEKWRDYAILQEIGVVDAFADIIKSYEKIRDAANSSSYTGDTEITPVSELVSYMGAEETKSVVEEKASPAAIKTLFRKIEAVGDVTARTEVDEQLETVVASFERYERAMKERVNDQNGMLLDAEKNILTRVNKRFNSSLDANSTSEIVDNLKRALSQTYIPPADWATRPENTGTLFVSDKYRAAVDLAYEQVQMNCPNLNGVPLDTLKIDNVTQTFFAQFVASKILEIELTTNDRLTLNNAASHNVLRSIKIMRNLQKVARPVGHPYRPSAAMGAQLQYNAAFSGAPIPYGQAPLPYGGLVPGHNLGDMRPLAPPGGFLVPRNDVAQHVKVTAVPAAPRKRPFASDDFLQSRAPVAVPSKQPFDASELSEVMSRLEIVAGTMPAKRSNAACVIDIQRSLRDQLDDFASSPATRNSAESAAQALGLRSGLEKFADEVRGRQHDNATYIRWGQTMALAKVFCETLEAEKRRKK